MRRHLINSTRPGAQDCTVNSKKLVFSTLWYGRRTEILVWLMQGSGYRRGGLGGVTTFLVVAPIMMAMCGV
jgi:hypothetical protein